jgi:hypothetical protein
MSNREPRDDLDLPDDSELLAQMETLTDPAALDAQLAKIDSIDIEALLDDLDQPDPL